MHDGVRCRLPLGLFVVGAALLPGCNKMPVPQPALEPLVSEAIDIERINVEPQQRPKAAALPEGVRVEQVRLRDMQRVVVAAATVAVPDEGIVRSKAWASGVIGRPTAHDGSWPTAGVGVADCAVLMQQVPDAALPPRVAAEIAVENRRCVTQTPDRAVKGRADAARVRPRRAKPAAQALIYRAPCAGWLLWAPHAVGKQIAEGTPLFKIGCRGVVELRLEPDTTRTFKAEAVTAAWLLDPAGLGASELGDRQGRALVWRLVGDNPAAVPGAAVQVALAVGVGRPALTVPTSAIELGEERAFVFVLGADNVAVRRKVVLGDHNPILTEIKGGLQPDDRVVVAGFEAAGIERAPFAPATP